MNDDDESPSIVLDCGATSLRAGIAGEESPKIQFPACVGYPPEMAHLQIKPGESWKGAYHVGHEALRLSRDSPSGLLVKWPVSQGVPGDWDAMEKLWTKAFEELMVTPAEEYAGVLLSDAPTCPKDARERSTHIMFERFQLPNFYVASQPLLAMYAAGRVTGVVVDSGEDLTHVVPVLDGYPLPYAAQRLPVAGRSMTEAVLAALTAAKPGIALDRADTTKIKHDFCRVAMDYDSEVTACRDGPKSYTLPDGTAVSIGEEQVKATELLFTPESHGCTHRGLHHVVYKVVMDCEFEHRKELWANIVTVGGTTLLKNFPERLELAAGAMAPSANKVSVTAPPDRAVSTWMGGSILASLSTFSQMWITKEEYDESGPAIVHRKCVVMI